MKRRSPLLLRLLRACLGITVLLLIVGIAGGLLLLRFGPELLLRSLDFEPEGSVETFWQTLESVPIADESIAQSVPELPALLLALEVTPPFVSTPVMPTAILPPTGLPTSAPAVATVIPTALPASPLPSLRRLMIPTQLNLSAEGYLNATIPSDRTFAESLVFAQQDNGNIIAAAVYQENALRSLCDTWLNGCQNNLFQLQSVDFRPGGVIVYGRVILTGGLTQDLGGALVLEQRGGVYQFRVAGLVYGGILYRLPASGQIADTVNSLLLRGNEALARLTLRADGYNLRLREVLIDDQRLTVIWGM